MSANRVVDFGTVDHPAFEEFLTELATARTQAAELIKIFEVRVGFIAVNFALVEILHRGFAGIASDSHG